MMLDKQRLRSFLLGGLTGVLAGILLAPRSGKETRGNIADRAGEVREKSRERYFDTRESMRESFSANREGEAARFDRSDAPGAEDEPSASNEEVRERPVLRDVSRDVPSEGGEDSGEAVSRSEELRRKVRETRERIRSRATGPAEKGAGGGDEE